MTGFNPDFGMIEHIYSHHVKIFGVITTFLFLQEYCFYFLIELLSLIDFYYDNEKVITKLTQLIANINYFDENYKTTDLDAIM